MKVTQYYSAQVKKCQSSVTGCFYNVLSWNVCVRSSKVLLKLRVVAHKRISISPANVVSCSLLHFYRGRLLRNNSVGSKIPVRLREEKFRVPLHRRRHIDFSKLPAHPRALSSPVTHTLTRLLELFIDFPMHARRPRQRFRGLLF